MDIVRPHITIYIKEILEDLGEITGEVVTEDIINEIFSKFYAIIVPYTFLQKYHLMVLIQFLLHIFSPKHIV